MPMEQHRRDFDSIERVPTRTGRPFCGSLISSTMALYFSRSVGR
jgi:hypothetical protein